MGNHKSPFRVLIVGASASGLSLALMLEQHNIDYLILEAHPEVSTHAGAAVALLPSGLRILDQLGVYDDLKALSDSMPLTDVTVRSPEDKTIVSCSNAGKQLSERHGYPAIFMSRNQCQEVMYKRIRNKSNVLVNKRVTEVITAASEVKVRTTDGTIYSGDILVGGDGIRSPLRQEMWRLGSHLSPGYFEADEMARVPVSQVAMFGISHPRPQLPRSEVINTYRHGYSYSVIPGNDLRVYWFLVANLDRSVYGEDVPRGTLEDQDELVEGRLDDNVAPGVAFRDLYDTSERTIMAPLHEHVFEKWHFQRITTLGDAGHKYNPMTGHGANSAIETAAVLVNTLHRELGDRTTRVSDDNIDAIFAEVQEKRWHHVKNLVEKAADQARISSLSTVVDEVAARVVIPQTDLETILFNNDTDAGCQNAARLGYLELPHRPRQVPFVDELPEKPLSKSTSTVAAGLVTFFLAVCCGFAIHSRYFGASGAGTDSPSVSWFLPTLRLVNTWAPLFLLWTIEARRLGNRVNVLRLGTIFLFVAQWLTPDVILPVYHLSSVWLSHSTSITGRQVQPEVWQAISPSLILGFFVPLISTKLWSGGEIIWRLSPMIVSLMVYAGAFSARRSASIARQGAKPPVTCDNWRRVVDCHSAPDAVYGDAVFALTAIHIVGLFSMLGQGSSQIWFKLPYLAMTTSSGVCFASNVIFSAYSIFRARERGYINTKETKHALAAVVLGSIFLGSSATYVGTTWWVERTIDGIVEKSVNGNSEDDL